MEALKSKKTFSAEVGKTIRTFSLILSNERRATGSSPKYGKVASVMRQNFGTKVLSLREGLHALSPSRQDLYLAQISNTDIRLWFSDRSLDLQTLRETLIKHIENLKPASKVQPHLDLEKLKKRHRDQVEWLNQKIAKLQAEVDRLSQIEEQVWDWKRTVEIAEFVVSEQAKEFNKLKQLADEQQLALERLTKELYG